MIALILGTSAELIKCMPIFKRLEKVNLDYFFIHTGQHNLEPLLNDFELRPPDYVLYEPPKLSSRFMVKTHKAIFWDIPLVFKIMKVLKEIKPLNYVFYHGDTMSTAAGAIASSNLLNLNKAWQNAHLEAGLRSNDLFEPFPEEISRKIADRFSDILFAVSDGTVENLKKEKLKGRIVNVGNTIIDSAHIALKIAEEKFGKLKEKNFCLINIHRHENIKSKERLEKIVEIITKVGIPAYWPMHDNTKQQLIRFDLMKKIEENENIKISKLLSYIEFIRLLANCGYLITDGGSIQEESLAFRKPCIILRMRTERNEGLKTGINFLTNLNFDYTVELIRMMEQKQFKVPKFKNPYGDGKAAKKIIDCLVK